MNSYKLFIKGEWVDAASGETFHTDPTNFSFTTRRPWGTVVGLSPWNSPLILAMYKVAYGLVTNDITKALYLADGLEAGMVHVNNGSIDADAVCPFGGCKSSGQGREGGRYSLESMTQVKWVTIQKSQKQYPFYKSGDRNLGAVGRFSRPGSLSG